MSKKIIILVIVIIAVAAVGVIINNYSLTVKPATNNNVPNQNVVKVASVAKEIQVKEFIIESFVEFVNEKPKPQYSIKEITVNKGDLVRIKITVTSGNHDFKIDELGVYADTKLNQEMIVEFTADKVGEFVYYCTKPGHRQAGHWGTLKVVE